MAKPLINPGMKVAELLDHWPELEEVLVAQAPAFQKLRNPILRRTVARVATLEQAAGIAGIGARDLVRTLRQAIGQPTEPGATGDADDSGSVRLQPDLEGDPPAWFDPARIVNTIDADALLAAGQVPLNAAFAAVRVLKPGDILEISATFRPVPLVENFLKQGHRCYLRAWAPGKFHLYATPGGAGRPD